VGQRGHCESREFFHGKGNDNQLGTGFFVQYRRPAVKTADRMLYIVLTGHWCNIIVLKLHVQNEEKSDDSKDSFY
jgi:hypothetical protein